MKKPTHNMCVCGGQRQLAQGLHNILLCGGNKTYTDIIKICRSSSTYFYQTNIIPFLQRNFLLKGLGWLTFQQLR